MSPAILGKAGKWSLKHLYVIISWLQH